MFNFLNSTFLFAASAALIPLIIHLFSKRKVKVVEFSSVKHLKAMQKRQVRRLKIRQLLLLLLRMLIILSIVLAFARPTTEGGNIGSHASVSAVIIFDNSASMDRHVANGNLFEIAKKRTEQILESLSESDEAVLLPSVISSDQSSAAFTTSAAALTYLNRLEIANQEADLKSVLSKAVDLLKKAKNLNKEFYLITDRQIQSLPENYLLKNIDANVYIVSLPLEEIDNCGITSLDFAGQLILPGHDFNLSAKIKNYSSTDKDNIIASLFIDGNRVSQTDINIKAASDEVVRFTRSVSNTGYHSGYVELSDDKFISDNRYYFSFRIPERSNLLIIDGDYTGQLFSLALAPSKDVNQYWAVKTTTPDNLSGVKFWEYDVIVITGAPKLETTYIDRLKSFLARGRTIFITYDGQTDINFYNKYYAELTGVTYEKGIDKNFTRAGYYGLLSFEADHPVFSVFNFENNKLPDIKFWSLPRFSLEDDVTTLMRFTGDHPALVERAYKSGKVMTFTGPMSPSYSDITSHAFFVPFISRIVEYSASDLSQYDLRQFCGVNITRSINYQGTLNKYFTVIKPDSSTLAISPEDSKGSLLLKINQADLPGIYSITLSGREINRFALNINPAECDLAFVDPDRMAQALGVEDYNLIEENIEVASILAQFRFGRELWHIFLWLAVILLIIEILLSRSSLKEDD